MRRIVALAFFFLANSAAAAVVVDDFSATSRPDPWQASNADTRNDSGPDRAAGTLFGHRQIALSIDNRPVGDRSLTAEFLAGSLRVSTSSNDTRGGLALYHDSRYEGPYVDFSPFRIAGGEIVIAFSETPTHDLATTIALRAVDGTLIYRPVIPVGTTLFRLSLSDFSVRESATSAQLSATFETRWFFLVPAGSSFALDSISVVPEASPLALLAAGLVVVGLSRVRCSWRTAVSGLTSQQSLCTLSNQPFLKDPTRFHCVVEMPRQAAASSGTVAGPYTPAPFTTSQPIRPTFP